MTPDPAISVAPSTVPAEISDNIGVLRNEVQKLQQELAQALDVWQTTLSAERSHFSDLIKHKELAWSEQENQWAQQSLAYEKRLEELKSEFEERLKHTEQSTAQALAQLDDDWQRDKLEWGARQEWPAERRALEEKITLLENALEEKKSATSPTPETVHALESQLLEFQQTVSSFQDRAARSDELVNACVQALDYQISVLYDLVHHYQAAPSGVEPPVNLAQS